MKVTFISKTDLAQAYFPYINMHSARHKLMQLIYEDAPLLCSLIETGYTKLQRSFSPCQLSLIYGKLGNPFH